MAELLKEKYVSGMVVDIEKVKEIKRRIGDPKMLAQDEPETEEAPKPKSAEEKKTASKSLKSRRLYRNIEERVFGGVCSGLGTYFGLDKVLFRLIFIIDVVQIQEVCNFYLLVRTHDLILNCNSLLGPAINHLTLELIQITSHRCKVALCNFVEKTI